MTLVNSSGFVSPWDTIPRAYHTVTSKNFLAIVNTDSDGHVQGSKPIYCYTIPEQVHVAAASTVHWDLFNADAALLVRVLSIRQRPSIVTAVTGAAFNWTFQRTTSVGTGGSARTAWLADTSQTALDADITCRSKPSGGAGAGTALRSYAVHSEETNVGVIAIAAQGGLELIPSANQLVYNHQGILLRQDQGLSVTQTTNSNAGNTGWDILFTVE